jgi:hypothetical protein
MKQVIVELVGSFSALILPIPVSVILKGLDNQMKIKIDLDSLNDYIKRPVCEKRRQRISAII